MNVQLLASGVFDKGGISRYTRYQIRALRDLLGPEQVSVLSLLGPEADSLEEPFEVDFHAHGTSIADKVAFIRAVRRIRAERNPGVIWCNLVNLLPLAVPLSRGRTLLANIYGLELWSGRAFIHKRLLPFADYVISDCHWSAEYVIREYGIPADRIHVIWDCVDTQRFCPMPRDADLLRRFGVPLGPEFRYVLTLGRMSKDAAYKGYDRLLDALAALREHPHVIALFAGRGDDVPRLKRRAIDLGLRERAFFLGAVHEDELAAVYNLAHVFSLVSHRERDAGEGIPLTPLEAAACGKPIIVGNEDGSQEAVLDGVNGSVVSPRDPAQLPAAILRVLDYSDAMGLAARRRIEEEFSFPRFVQRHAELLPLIQAKH